jgi:hypothetical protein
VHRHVAAARRVSQSREAVDAEVSLHDARFTEEDKAFIDAAKEPGQSAAEAFERTAHRE